MSLAKVANEFEEAKAPSRWQDTINGLAIGAGVGAGIGAIRGYDVVEKSKENDALLKSMIGVEDVTNPLTKSRYKVPRVPYVAGGALNVGASFAPYGAGIGFIRDKIRHRDEPQEKVANEFNEEQEPSEWHNAVIGASMGASIGAPLGIATGISAHKRAEGRQTFRNAFTHPELRGPFAKTVTHDHLRANLSRGPYLASGVLLGGVGTGLLGAGVGALTDVARRKTLQEKVASFTMTSLYK